MADSHSRFIWHELTTTDMQPAKTFYAAVVGWGARDASMAGLTSTVFTAVEASVSGMMELPHDNRTPRGQLTALSDGKTGAVFTLQLPVMSSIEAATRGDERNSKSVG